MRLVLALGTAFGFLALVVIARTVDGSSLRSTAEQAADEPLGVTLALGAFGLAFGLRAVAWTRVLGGLSLGQSLAAIHVTLGANHVLPFRLGEPLRVVSVVRREGVGAEAAAASTITLRAADILAVVVLGLAVAPGAYLDLVGWVGWIALLGVVAVAVVGWRWLATIVTRRADVAMPDIMALALATVAWLLEAVLVWQTAHWAGIHLSWTDAVLVTTVAVVAQIAAIAPGGVGTYEAAAVVAYVSLGHDADAALVAAIGTHALKTAYSLVVGAVGLVVPGPSLIGRCRLGAAAARSAPAAPAGGPVVLFMPAFNEAAAVADCVNRTPKEVLGHPVEVLVIDDGSSDATVAEARRAGAEVVVLDRNRGLGAAVRVGLCEGVIRRGAAVVFCDADGEYGPEELADVVRPILDGEADYVIGSRFLGRIDHMRAHRRLGNLVLTRVLSIVARRRITDGQSGYRALSLEAAEAAEIIHDFNYAQVLTLDLLAKGFRYTEVPISYHFRTTGESFVRLGPYLNRVVPAVYRELNSA